MCLFICKHRTNHKNTLFGQNAAFLNSAAGGTYSNHKVTTELSLDHFQTRDGGGN